MLVTQGSVALPATCKSSSFLVVTANNILVCYQESTKNTTLWPISARIATKNRHRNGPIRFTWDASWKYTDFAEVT